MIRARVECIGSRPEPGRELCHGRPSTSQPIFRPLFGPEKAKAQFQKSWDAWKAWVKLEEGP